ncbi:FHA domain-containing protein [Micromonospora sp. WMMD1102]|uniref:FHA domain-containing protein n=1 Tax=Micromonospora sp. WMMD1102 TaxID=3016105 RepID=UPI002414F6FD|nr:FHA domain-containing protein [Micromonospora sp. WMMD1102]MDG4789235.1 FHA domain-containing protein [Micromonospora sp. WMMD1102]
MTIREPDPGTPFVSVLLIPGHTDPTVDLAAAADTVDLSAAETAPLRPRPVLVEGADCKRGHFNDPAARFCQQCGIAMHQLTLVTRRAPRPPLGVLLLDDGTTFRLDTDYVVGRAPEADGEVTAGRARALRIAGDGAGVSRRHLRVVLTGWQVRVLDLGSANGTGVRLPGDPSTDWVGAGTPVRVVPGSRVDFGSRWLRYESHRNL